MDTHRVRLFVTAARYLSISRAAEKHRISQPAVTRQLKILQRDDVGLVLYKNQGRGIVLTEAGRAFYDDAVAMMLNVEQFEKDHGRQNANSIIIAASQRPSKYLLPALMTEFSKKHPSANLTLRTRSSVQIERLLMDSNVDFAITTNPTVSVSAFVTETIGSERLTAFVAASHPLAQKSSVTASDLFTFPVIVKLRRNGQSRVEAQLSKFKIEETKLKTVMRCESADVVKALVKHGAGVGFLYYNSIKRGIDRGRFKAIRFPELEATGHNYLVYSKEISLSPIAREFLSLVRASTAPIPPVDALTPKISHKRRDRPMQDNIFR